MPPDPSADQARTAIAAALGQIGFSLPGSITIRHARCGKPRCACAADPPSLHGPCIQWTRTVRGKTVTRLLTPAQYQAYAPWFANARRLRELAAELEALSLAEMARASGMVTTLPPLRVIVIVRCPRSRPRCSMSAPVASETRSPFSASSEISACSHGGPSPAATSKAPSSLRSRATACDS